MEQKDVKEQIEVNKSCLPLSFHENLIFIERKNMMNNFKFVKEKGYNDNNYVVIKFYKSISRF